MQRVPLSTRTNAPLDAPRQKVARTETSRGVAAIAASSSHSAVKKVAFVEDEKFAEEEQLEAIYAKMEQAKSNCCQIDSRIQKTNSSIQRAIITFESDKAKLNETVERQLRSATQAVNAERTSVGDRATEFCHAEEESGGGSEASQGGQSTSRCCDPEHRQVAEERENTSGGN